MGYKWWVDAFIRGHSPGDSANLESGPFWASQVGRKLFSKSVSLTPLPLLQMDTEAALVKAFGEVDILLTWMQKFYHLWLSARMMSSFVFHAISSCCLHLCCPWTLGHRLTPWLAQASLRLPSSAVHMTVMEGVLNAVTDPQGGFTYLLQLYLNNCHCFRGNHTYLWAWTLHESSRMQSPMLPWYFLWSGNRSQLMVPQ